MSRPATFKSLPAFTMIELLVSLAVISLALAAVGVIFTSTTNAAGVATAMQEYDVLLRQIAQDLEADLDGIDPAQSVILIKGRTQAASLTAQDRDAGYYFRMPVGFVDPKDTSYDTRTDSDSDAAEKKGYGNPRADLLMFVTQRPMRSQVPPSNIPSDNNQYYSIRARFNSDHKYAPAMVVYGHAAIDSANADGDGFANNLTHITDGNNYSDLSPLPASDWILARRATILTNERFDGGDDLYEIDNGEEIMTMVAPENSNYGADVTSYSWKSSILSQLQPGGTYAGCALEDPYDADSWGGTNCNTLFKNELRDQMLFANKNNDNDYHIATVIPDPPQALRSNLGLQALPHCVWFQVEFLMPEDIRNNPNYNSPEDADPDNDYRGFENKYTRFDMPLWTSVDPEKTYVFLPDTPAARTAILSDPDRYDDFSEFDQDGGGNGEKSIRVFPYGLRITVRIADPQGRIAEPLERVIVHYFD